MKGRAFVAAISHAAAFAALVLFAAGCPYETSIAPAGRELPLHASLAGKWTCRSPEANGGQREWALLQIGWSGRAYLLTLRPPVVDPADADEVPWVVRAKPMRLGGDEVWVLEEERQAPPRFYFARLERSSALELQVAVLGRNGGAPDGLVETSPAALARALGDRTKLGVDQRITCRRPPS